MIDILTLYRLVVDMVMVWVPVMGMVGIVSHGSGQQVAVEDHAAAQQHLRQVEQAYRHK